MKRKRISHLFAFVLMLFIGLIMVFPLFWMVRSSVMTQSEIFRKPMQWLPERIQWKNYVDIMTLRPFARWICNSAFIVVFNVLGTMLTCGIFHGAGGDDDPFCDTAYTAVHDMEDPSWN